MTQSDSNQKNWEPLAENAKFNFRKYDDGSVGVTIDEETKEDDIFKICKIFEVKKADLLQTNSLNDKDKRKTDYLTHDVFNSFHSETEMLRYIHKLETKDLSLNTSMIPLGSCTMKLNATTEMVPVTWPEFSNIHHLYQ